jgi:hypothetical protein
LGAAFIGADYAGGVQKGVGAAEKIFDGRGGPDVRDEHL